MRLNVDFSIGELSSGAPLLLHSLALAEGWKLQITLIIHLKAKIIIHHAIIQ